VTSAPLALHGIGILADSDWDLLGTILQYSSEARDGTPHASVSLLVRRSVAGGVNHTSFSVPVANSR